VVSVQTIFNPGNGLVTVLVVQLSSANTLVDTRSKSAQIMNFIIYLIINLIYFCFLI